MYHIHEGLLRIWYTSPSGRVSILYLPNRLVRYSILVLFISGWKLREITLFSAKNIMNNDYHEQNELPLLLAI